MNAVRRSLIYFGRFLETSGYAAEARSYALGLRQLGFRIQLLPLAERFPCRDLIEPAELAELEAMEAERLEPGRAVALLHQKPDTFPDLQSPVRIARTTFETDRIPASWVPRLNAMSEVWVTSRFNLETFAAAGVRPDKLRRVRQGIDTARFTPAAKPLALPGRRGFTFLSAFTWQERKGWDVLVKAYASAFTPDDDVSLLIWAQSYYRQPEQMRADLQHLLEADLGLKPNRVPSIVLLTDPCPDSAMPGLYTACDAFVLPSRGEGWGRPLAEAMACGKPVIGTAWGGNLDFMGPANSYLLEIEGLEPVGAESCVPQFRGHRWAAPSVEHLRQLMRYVAAHPAEAAVRGAVARSEMAAHWDLRQTVAEMAAELDRIAMPACGGEGLWPASSSAIPSIHL